MADNSVMRDNMGDNTPNYPINHNMVCSLAELQRQLNQLLAAEERRQALERAQAEAQAHAKTMYDNNIMMYENREEGTLAMCIRAEIQQALEQLNAEAAQRRQTAQHCAQQQSHGRQPFCVHFNKLMDDTYFEIHGGMIRLLPKFRGTSVDNPLTHLRDVHRICNALRPRDVDEGEFMIRMFLYSLTDYAKSWIFSLSVDSMPKWDQMRQLFLKEYSIKQHPQEATHEYLERFNDLLATCRDYSFPEHVLIISFLDGMDMFERETMDALAGGSILDCYPEDVWELIYKRASQTKLTSLNAQLEELAQLLAQPVAPLVLPPLAQPVAQTQNNNVTEIQMSEDGVTQISDIISEYDDTVLEVESIEEVCANEESMYVPTPVALEDLPTSDSIVKEEEQDSAQDETLQLVHTICKKDMNAEIEELISSQRTDTTTEQSIVVYMPNMLHVPNVLISSQILECKHKELDKGKIQGAHHMVTTRSPSVHTHKRRRKHKRSVDEVHVKWKSRKKAKRTTMDEEVSSHSTLTRMRQSNYVWKPGLDFYGSANSAKAERKMRRSWNKFDGAHPWAPNL